MPAPARTDTDAAWRRAHHVVTAVGLLRDGLAEPWTLDALAEQVHLSRSQLLRAFNATVGMSPMDYLRRCGSSEWLAC